MRKMVKASRLIKKLRRIRDIEERKLKRAGRSTRYVDGFTSGMNLAINKIALELDEDLASALEKMIKWQEQKYFPDPKFKKGVIDGLKRALAEVIE